MFHKKTVPPWPSQPILYEVNTRLWLRELSQRMGKLITLANVPVSEIEPWVGLRFDGIWLMGVWKISRLSQATARQERPMADYRKSLPDLSSPDIMGSPYAIADYRVEPLLGGEEGLNRFRRLLHEQGLRLVLDFVPNHVAPDHPWLFQHPDYFIHGTPAEFKAEPENWFRREIRGKLRLYAHGKDPFFPSWRDTAQLNYNSADLRAAMRQVLKKISALCDGIRCDMAMLILTKVFRKGWGERRWGSRKAIPHDEFWSGAISEVRKRSPNFLFLAEAYWGLEWDLQQLGFDYTYDKVLYDRLRDSDLEGIRKHLRGYLNYQLHTCRFLENHDEERSATLFGPRSKACALLTGTVPGMKLFHDGQLEGRKLKVPVQLVRRPGERRDSDLEQFYTALLKEISTPIYHEGMWRLLEILPATPEDTTHTQLFASVWKKEMALRLSLVNLGKEKAQGILTLPTEEFSKGNWLFRDIFSGLQIEKSASELSQGLAVELAPYGFHLFEVTSI